MIGKISKQITNIDLSNKDGVKVAGVIQHQADQAQGEYITKEDMKFMLMTEYSPEKLEAQLKNCCSEHKKCSEDLARLADCINELARMKPGQYAERVAGMEVAL